MASLSSLSPARLDRDHIRAEATRCGFELAGIAAALPPPEMAHFESWVAAGFAGEMRYLTDHRAEMRGDPRNLLPKARSVICVGKLYNTPQPYSIHWNPEDLAWVSRYAWGDDYHDIVKRGLERLVERLLQIESFEFKICVDTAPLLERSYARLAGLGWIGKNTCLINQQMGSWFFLGEVLVSLEMPPDSPPPDRCGTCTRCIDACPTQAIVPVTGLRAAGGPAYAIDSRLCISYLTIELKSAIPASLRELTGNHVFGCDICQDVCPWNRRSPVTGETGFAPREAAPPLEKLAALTEPEFREMFRHSPVTRARYRGFLRNVAVAMGNQRSERFRPALEKLSRSEDPLIAEHALWALGRRDGFGGK